MLAGEASDTVNVISGVPQRPALRPIIFLLYTNGLSNGISSGVRPFADNAIVDHTI